MKITSNPSPLTLRRTFWFWLPLAVMWLVMSAEQPSITAVVSRLPDATEHLAAFGLTFSLALIVESPVIMLLTAATALATHRQSYRRLLEFTAMLALVETVLHVALAVTPLYGVVVRDLIGAPAELVETSRVSFLLMTPWTGMIAFRRLFEGVMIRWGQPQRVTVVVVLRLATTALGLVAGFLAGRWPGAYVGAAALSAGVTVGALAAFLLSRSSVAEHLGPPRAGDAPLGWVELLQFYVPLVLTALITMVGGPIFSFGLSHAPLPLESLAAWPVITSLLFIGRSGGTAYQEVGVALLHRERGRPVLQRFAWLLAALSTGAFALVAVTPAAAWWYRNVSGLPPDLVDLALVPTLLAVPVPGLTVIISWLRAVLVHARRTGPVSAAVGLNMATLLGLMLLLPRVTTLPGAVQAAIGLALSLGVESAFLAWTARGAGVGLGGQGARGEKGTA